MSIAALHGPRRRADASQRPPPVPRRFSSIINDGARFRRPRSWGWGEPTRRARISARRSAPLAMANIPRASPHKARASRRLGRARARRRAAQRAGRMPWVLMKKLDTSPADCEHERLQPKPHSTWRQQQQDEDEDDEEEGAIGQQSRDHATAACFRMSGSDRTRGPFHTWL